MNNKYITDTFFQLRKIELMILVLIIIYPWVFQVFFGLYIPELGYWLVSYENFFTDPEMSHATVAGACWLTTLLGGIVNYFLGSLGVVGFKASNVFLIYLIMYTMYRLLITYSSRPLLLFSLLVAEIMVYSYDFINYYTLTTLFFIIASFYLYKGLILNRYSYFFITGILLSLNMFIRFSNVIGLGLVVVILYYELGKGSINLTKIMKKIGILFFGYIFTIFIILLIMKFLGHYYLYMDNIRELLASSAGEEAYGTSKIINKYFLAQYIAVKKSIYIFSIFLFFAIARKFSTASMIVNYTISLMLIIVFTYLLIRLSGTAHANYFPMYPGIIGFFYLSLLWIAYSKYVTDINFGVIALLAFLVIEMIPFGSATILHQAKFGSYMVIPIIFVYLFSIQRVESKNPLLKGSSFQYAGLMSGMIFMAYTIFSIVAYHPPGLESNFLKMTYTVNNPRLKANYMSKEKAQTLNELTDNIKIYSKNISYILTYEKISTVNYISGLKPYIKNSYPFFMTTEQLQMQLTRMKGKKTLPMVVRGKNDTTQKGWPKNMRQISGKKKLIEIRAVFEIFLIDNNYVSVWSNKDFEILIPFASPEY